MSVPRASLSGEWGFMERGSMERGGLCPGGSSGRPNIKYNLAVLFWSQLYWVFIYV